eukprot:TRINITY_DN19869_c0_g1_i1.p1 TRINITY_DN19869_c0_g1~~TRINITY_DN19869_c0_g1_i1.p1  ORF type:complete len:403 (-),score=50.40 TRINITY_DN19869_c0_g1_i1:47-1255(-)
MTTQETASPQEEPESSSLLTGLKFHTSQALAIPALALFCRLNADTTKTSFLQRQLLSATMYASATVKNVYEVMGQQQGIDGFSGIKQEDEYTNCGKHSRKRVDWTGFQKHRSSKLLHVVNVVNRKEIVKPDKVVLDAESATLKGFESKSTATWNLLTKDRWNGTVALATKNGAPVEAIGNDTLELVLSSSFWSIYWLQDEQASGCGSSEFLVIFRGGDGGAADACEHPGSPARPFVQGEDPNDVPAEIRELVVFLKGLVNVIKGCSPPEPPRLTFVGYSQGGLPALACHLLSKDITTMVHSCILLNAATVFWPRWLQNRYDKEQESKKVQVQLLPWGWWTEETSHDAKIYNWVIENDPLSEGLKAKSRAPQTPGNTWVLPQVEPQPLANHSLDNYIKMCRGF